MSDGRLKQKSIPASLRCGGLRGEALERAICCQFVCCDTEDATHLLAKGSLRVAVGSWTYGGE